MRQPPLPPTTIADGLLTGLSDRTFAIIRDHVEEIVTVAEAEIVEAMQIVWQYTKQLIEPSRRGRGRRGAPPFARRARASAIILSGGNVDLDPMFDTLR